MSVVYQRNTGKSGIAFNAQEIRERLMDDLRDKRVLMTGDSSAPHLVIGPLAVS